MLVALGRLGDHHRRMAAGRGPGQVGEHEIGHDLVAGGAGTAAEHDGDDLVAVRLGGGHQVEAGGAGIARLDAVDALDLAEQAVMAADRAAAVLEGARLEEREIARETLLDGTGEDGQIARRRQVRRRMRQAMRVVEPRRAHAERPRLPRHHLREGVLGAGDVLCHHDGGVVGGERDHASDRVADRQRRAGAKAELGRRLGGGVGRDLELGIHVEPAALHLLEQQVERHDLGQRCRDTRRVGVHRM